MNDHLILTFGNPDDPQTFTAMPHGRYLSDSKTRSAEAFREQRLRPALRQAWRITVDMRQGALSHPVMEEIFAGLLRPGEPQLDRWQFEARLELLGSDEDLAAIAEYVNDQHNSNVAALLSPQGGGTESP